MHKLSKSLTYLKLRKGKLHANTFSSTGDVLAIKKTVFSPVYRKRICFFKAVFVLVT